MSGLGLLLQPNPLLLLLLLRPRASDWSEHSSACNRPFKRASPKQCASVSGKRPKEMHAARIADEQEAERAKLAKVMLANKPKFAHGPQSRGRRRGHETDEQ